LITIFLKELRGDISLTLKSRNLESECIQKTYGDKADRFYGVCKRVTKGGSGDNCPTIPKVEPKFFR